MKKSLALMLALIMVLCMIPTTAFAADIIDQKNKVYIYKGEPQNSYFLRQIDGGSITKSKNEEVIWQRLPRYTSKCGRCNNVVEEVIPDLYCINPDKNIEITNPEVIGEYGVRVASWKGNDVYNGYPCFEFYCKAAKAGETDVKVTYYYNYNYRGASGSCNYCGNFVYVQAQINWYKESVTFHVTCETQEPPTDNPPTKPEPENTSKPVAGLTGKEVVRVECTTTNSSHAANTYPLIAGSYTVGEVSDDKEKGYTCEITVEPEKYVDQYNLDIEGGHKLDPESQIGKIKLKWKPDNTGDNTGSWEVVSDVPVVFDVKCDNTQPPLDKTITIEVSKIWEDDIPGARSITVGLYANGTKVDKKDITPNEGIWYHNFGPRPLEDNNGRDISYTIVEEPIDGYTPHYYTSGEHDKRLVFRVKNVPTEKTGAIKVSKELSGEGAEKDKEFAFTVTLLEYLDSNEVLDGGEPGYYPLSGIYTFGGFEFRDGKVTFGLKGGESVTISGIPAEYDYTVTESNNAGYTVTSENDKGTIRAKGTAEVKFTNTKSAAPTVSPTPTPTPGGGNGGGGHWHPTTTPVPVIVIPPKTGDMTIWQSILHFLGIR